MVKGTPKLIAERREEIIDACVKLYQKLSFKEITLKEIGKETSFSRPTIYNYFETKEEIFLALFEREYERWNEELNNIYNDNKTLSPEKLADKISRSLASREQLLKLLAMNNYDMEANSREERLAQFKKAYGATFDAVDRLLRKFCPEKSEEDRQSFIYSFFPFIYGIYPYTHVTDKQKTAMEQAEIPFIYHSAYDITYRCAIKLLT